MNPMPTTRAAQICSVNVGRGLFLEWRGCSEQPPWIPSAFGGFGMTWGRRFGMTGWGAVWGFRCDCSARQSSPVFIGARPLV